MKVISVATWYVFVTGSDDNVGLVYSIKVNGDHIISDAWYASASAAKQAMREKVAHERNRHGLSSSNGG